MAHDVHPTQVISAADYVISKFGGLSATAKAIGKPVTTVQGWRVRGKIPTEHWDDLMDAAKARDKLVTVDDFRKPHAVAPTMSVAS